jgi:SAM-dependent methyltransferase
MNYKNDFSGSAEYYDIILGKKEFELNSKFIEKLLKKYNKKNILELGCGTGLYLFPLKKAGFNIEGLDISKEMLKVVKKNKIKIKLYEKDMSSFKINKKYDSILCLNSSLILLPNIKLIEKTIKNVYNHLSKKGLFLIDLPNHIKEIKENNNSQTKKKYKISKGSLEIVFNDYKKGNKWISVWNGVFKEGSNSKKFKEHYEELIYSPKELEKYLKKAGFEIIDVFGSRRGGKFNIHKSWRRFYLCQKK